MMNVRAFTAALFGVLFFSTAGLAQVDDPVSVDSAIVRVNIGVVDQRGRPITSLGRPNFSVFEDGVKQDISHFELSSAPFSVVMMLDMSGSTKSFRQNIALSAARFMDALAPEDRIAVVEFYDKINVLNDFTSDRARIAHSIRVANGTGNTNLVTPSRSARSSIRVRSVFASGLIADAISGSASRDRNTLSLFFASVSEPSVSTTIAFRRALSLASFSSATSKAL